MKSEYKMYDNVVCWWEYKPPVSHDGTFSCPGPKAVHHQPANVSWIKPSTNKILHPDLNYAFVLMYLRCFLFSWSNPEVEAIEGGSIQLACSSHTSLKTKVSLCSSQTVMVPQFWTGWKQSHLSKLAAQSLQTPKLLIHKKKNKSLEKTLKWSASSCSVVPLSTNPTYTVRHSSSCTQNYHGCAGINT